MCFHSSLMVDARALARRYDRRTDLIEGIGPVYHVSAFTRPEYPVVTADRQVQLYHWGLVPRWVRSEEQAREMSARTFNARAESAFEKASFRGPVRGQRCLVPSTGFFDWQHTPDGKIPYFVRLSDEELFSLAGVWDLWRHPKTGTPYYGFSILTVEANALMQTIHNVRERMPAILLRSQEETWIDPATDEQHIRSLLRPYPSDRMEAWAIDNDFLRKAPDDPTILNPRTASVGQPG